MEARTQRDGNASDRLSSLQEALRAERRIIAHDRQLAIYFDARPDLADAHPPLLLIHSVNAAASAYEVRPLFDYYRSRRPVYAVDLPGFGQSDRSDRLYSVRVMTDAIVKALEEIKRIHHHPADAIALSLSCEFLARASVERPEIVGKLGFISPTGFEGKARDEAEGTRGKEWFRRILAFQPWSRSLFTLLTTRVVIRKFLEKTWGSKLIDEGLLNYDYETAHQLGAEFAPWSFVSGHLFGKDILNVYCAVKQPVWVVRGTRGDFVDYHHATRVEGLPNWTIDVLDGGAFPHFESVPELIDLYDRLCAGGQYTEAERTAVRQ
jgi:pimeloyl-ACP methyl ester carboxylesterase